MFRGILPKMAPEPSNKVEANTVKFDKLLDYIEDVEDIFEYV